MTKKHTTTTISILATSTILFFAGICSSFALHATDGSPSTIIKTSDVGLSFKGSITSADGQGDEYVYAGANNIGLPSDYKLSELNWDISSLWMVGGVFSLRLGELIRFNAGLWLGVTDGDGVLNDYDWLNYSTADWSDHSQSDTDIDAAYNIDINGSFQFMEIGPCQLHAVLGYKEDYWEWSAYGGTFLYSTDGGFRNTSGTFKNTEIINYNQTFDIPYGGIKLTTDSARLHASAYFYYSPSVTADDEDHHILRDLHYTESFDGGDYYAFGAEGIFDLSDTLYIACSLDFQDIPEFTGDMTMKNGSGDVELHTYNSAGIGNSLTTLSASIGIKF